MKDKKDKEKPPKKKKKRKNVVVIIAESILDELRASVELGTDMARAKDRA